MTVTRGPFERLSTLFWLSLGSVVLSGCATTQLDHESCMEGTSYQGPLLSYSLGKNFNGECSSGQTAAALVASMRNPDGTPTPRGIRLDQELRRTLSPAALSAYRRALEMTQNRLKPREGELVCKEEEEGKTTCHYHSASPTNAPQTP